MQNSGGTTRSTYSQFVLRDMLTYGAPGALLVASATIALSGDSAVWLSIVERLPMALFLPLFGVSVVVGMGLIRAAVAVHITRCEVVDPSQSDVATAHLIAIVCGVILLSLQHYLPEITMAAVLVMAAVVVFGLTWRHGSSTVAPAKSPEPAPPAPSPEPATKRTRSGGPRILGAVRGPGVMLSRTSGAPVELTEPDDAWFKNGEVWTYNSRTEEPDSRVTVLKVHTHSEVGNFVHVAVDGLRIRGGAKGRRERISHLVLLEEALARSVQTRVASDVEIPEFAEGYASWRKAWEAGDSCVFFVPLQHAISTMEDAVSGEPRPSPR